MNDFIRLRKNYLTQPETSQFPLTYLEKIEVSNKKTKKEKQIIHLLNDIFRLQQKQTLNQQDMQTLLAYLGTNDYIDGYIVTLFIENKGLFKEKAFGKLLINRIINENVTDSTVYALIDSCIECDEPFFSQEILLTLLAREGCSLDTFSMMIDYIQHFRMEGFQKNIGQWLVEDYPIPIKIQLIDLFADFYSIEMLKTMPFFAQEDQPVLRNYLKDLEKEHHHATNGFTILQSMFYGDFENSGKGNNGGLAIFLKNLGTELSKSNEIARVITLATTTNWGVNDAIITEYSTGHLFVNLPIYINKLNPTDFLKKEYFIKRTINRFLKRLGIYPDIYHVRFLDNASKAIARLTEEQDKNLVVTLTPDPHRNMTDAAGDFTLFSFNEQLEKLNKILIGDELIQISDKIVGIGSRVVKKELEQYFPQLNHEENRLKVQMISEGIQLDISLIKQEGKAITGETLKGMGLTKEFLEKPIILNVGRLNKLKAQDQLLKAWMNSEMSTVYNLLIVGGDLEHPNAEESEMIELFNEYLAKNPALKKNFLHLGALSNDQIRKLEQKIRAKQTDYPQLYLCSSKKEEFGIAILEALAERFLVLGPKKGGVKSYIEDGVNGFLIDTTDWQTIAEATEEIIDSLKDKTEAFEKIQQAGQTTVQDNFAMAIITQDFLSLYLSLKEKE